MSTAAIDVLHLRAARSAVLADAATRSPEEACGFVIETPDGLQVRPAPNISPTRTVAFELPAGAIIAAHQAGRVVAVYHSHPGGPATLSAADRAALAGPTGPLWPGVEQWVVGLGPAKVVDLVRFVWDSRRFAFTPVDEGQ